MPERAPNSAPSFQSDLLRSQHGLAEEYAALEQTLRNSTIGRWFLAEHARRNRTPETQLLLDAIARLEAVVRQPQSPHPSDILAELTRLNEAIGQMMRDLAALNPLHRSDARRADTGALDQIVKTADEATSHILSAAEDVQQVSRSLRELGAPAHVCDRLDRDTLDIHVACASQDIAGQKTAKVVQMLNDLAQRINALVGAEGGSEPGWATDETADDAPARRTAPANASRGTEYGSPSPRAPGQARACGFGGDRFERPDPLSLPELEALKRAALFG